MGSNFIRHIYNSYPEYKIYNLDLLTYAGNQDNLKDVEEKETALPVSKKRYHFIRGDVCDCTLLDNLFSKYHFNLVVNFAAETHVDRSLINMSDFIRTNIGGVRALIETMQENKVSRFVHISTDEVYGTIDEGQAHEESILKPSNPYAASKAAADLLLQTFMRAKTVPAIIVRSSNNYGPFQYPEKLIPLAISNLIEGRKIPVHGNGEHVRSWLHVEDFCRAVDNVVHRGRDFQIYNVSGEELTNLEVLRAVAAKVGRDFDSHREHIGDRPGADMRYALDSSKLQKELGWERKHKFEKSIAGVVDWYMRNRGWWEKIKGTPDYLTHYEKQSTGQWY